MNGTKKNFLPVPDGIVLHNRWGAHTSPWRPLSMLRHRFVKPCLTLAPVSVHKDFPGVYGSQSSTVGEVRKASEKTEE